MMRVSVWVGSILFLMGSLGCQHLPVHPERPDVTAHEEVIEADADDVFEDTAEDEAADEPPETTAEVETTDELPEANKITLARLQGHWSLPFSVAIDGMGSERLGLLQIDGVTGSVEVEGQSTFVFVDQRIPWAAFGYTLYQLVAVRADQWFVLWAYCESGQLTWVYLEAVDGTPLTYEAATGTCGDIDGETVAPIDLPAVDLPFPAAPAGFSVDGPQIQLAEGGGGYAQAGEERWELYPFNQVDCTTDCGTPGWWEIHSLLWGPERREAGFGIVYLFLDPNVPTNAQVSLVPSILFPTLRTSPSTFFEASWTAPR